MLLLSKMNCKEIEDYRNLPFVGVTNAEMEFYTYNDISTLLAKCEKHKDRVINCRAIGILKSSCGRFLLKEIDCKDADLKIRVSMQNVKTCLPPTVPPYVVQMFGVLQWTNKPVIFARIVQVLDPATGVRLHRVLKSIASLHMANTFCNEDQSKDELNQY